MLLPWAWSPSEDASAMAAGPMAARAVAAVVPRELIQVVRLRKSNTESPEAKRAERPVGRTWLGPPT